MADSGWPVDRGPADRAAGRRPAAKGMLVARSSRRAAASRARGAVRIGGDPESAIYPPAFCGDCGAGGVLASLPEYLARYRATACACAPVTMFSGMIAPENPPLRI